MPGAGAAVLKNTPYLVFSYVSRFLYKSFGNEHLCVDVDEDICVYIYISVFIYIIYIYIYVMCIIYFI